MKALENLFFGNNIPFTLPALDRAENRRLSSALEEVEDPLYDSMSAEQKKLYNQYHDRLAELTESELRDAFIRGFRMGVQVILEALEDEKAPAAEA